MDFKPRERRTELRLRDLNLESEPVRSFFDYERDIPFDERSEIEELALSDENNKTYHFLRQIGKTEDIDLEILGSEREDLEEINKKVDWNQVTQGDTEEQLRAATNMDKFLQLSLMLNKTGGEEEKIKDQARLFFSPDILINQIKEFDYIGITVLFIGYTYYPEWRGRYKQIIQEKLDEIFSKIFLEYTSDTDGVRVVFDLVGHLRIMLPEKVESFRAFIKPLYEKWSAASDWLSFDEVMTMSILGSDEAVIDEQGELHLTEKPAAISRAKSLPGRDLFTQ